ncbi:MAG TPA: glycosyltransferase family 4 protein [Spirochaetota bacterium]|nr:glycosyltransferase family 4 protein [Spirochaetota bacterium]
MKIFLLGSGNIGPYHHARFSAASRIIPEFVYLKVPSRDVYRPWGVKTEVATFKVLSALRLAEVWTVLKSHRPDVVVTAGYANPSLFIAALWARMNDIPVVMLSDSTIQDKPRNILLEWIKRRYVKFFYAAAFVAGVRSGDYARLLGIGPGLIRRGVDVVDNSHFYRDESVHVSAPASRHFLCVSRLAAEKNLVNLIKAFELYRGGGGTWRLVVAGDGPQSQYLKSIVPKNLGREILFPGWVGYGDLPSFYHAASCFILPSFSESWGLVVNEAMAAGLPVLISEKCGAAPDLCENGVNGFVFDPQDVGEMSEKMAMISSGELDLVKMGRESRRIVSAYTPRAWAETFCGICADVLKAKTL